MAADLASFWLTILPALYQANYGCLCQCRVTSNLCGVIQFLHGLSACSLDLAFRVFRMASYRPERAPFPCTTCLR